MVHPFLVLAQSIAFVVFICAACDHRSIGSSPDALPVVIEGAFVTVLDAITTKWSVTPFQPLGIDRKDRFLYGTAVAESA
jgi:hypothetical protein